MNKRNLIFIVTGLLLGFLIFLQSRSFQEVQVLYNRDTRANAFHEIQILKRLNEDLEEEVKALEEQLQKASNQEEALQLIQAEIEKNKILSGYTDIQGPGVEIVIQDDVPLLWLTDLVNELWSAGGEAVSVNDTRLVNSTMGIDVLPNGQMTLNHKILKSPIHLMAIGDQKVLIEALYQKGGILERFQQNFPEISLEVKAVDLLSMKKVADLN